MQPGQIFMVTLPQSVPMATPAPVLPTATFTPSPAACTAAGVGAGIAAAAAGLATVPVGPDTNTMQILWACNDDEKIFTATLPDEKPTPADIDWRRIQGACVQMDVSKAWIYNVNTANKLYRKPVNEPFKECEHCVVARKKKNTHIAITNPRMGSVRQAFLAFILACTVCAGLPGNVRNTPNMAIRMLT